GMVIRAAGVAEQPPVADRERLLAPVAAAARVQLAAGGGLANRLNGQGLLALGEVVSLVDDISHDRRPPRRAQTLPAPAHRRRPRSCRLRRQWRAWRP